MACGVATALIGWWVSQHQVLVAYPGLASFPQVTLAALVGCLIGLLPAVVAPEPRVVLA